MAGNQKTGKQLLDEFFARLESEQRLDKETAQLMNELWESGKLNQFEIIKALKNSRIEKGGR